MKICISCQQVNDRKRASTCSKCRSAYFRAYQEKYRSDHRKQCYARSQLSQMKKLQYYRLKRRERYRRIHGIPLDDPSEKRKDGEGTIDNCGYHTITVRGHPNQMDSKGRIRKHVYVMSQYLGRPLIKGETVHHKNGDKLDNRIENLELWSRSQPAGQRVEDRIAWCIEFLTNYGYVVAKSKV